MDLTFDEKQEAWRDEVRTFLASELPEHFDWDSEYDEDEQGWEFALAFTRKIAQKGWIGLTWPEEYGGLARPAIDKFILWEELIRSNAPVVNHIGWGLAANALLAGGTHEQKLRFLRPIARMETFWAEGLTEPDSGFRPGVAAYDSALDRRALGVQRSEDVHHLGHPRRRALPRRSDRP